MRLTRSAWWSPFCIIALTPCSLVRLTAATNDYITASRYASRIANEHIDCSDQHPYSERPPLGEPPQDCPPSDLPEGRKFPISIESLDVPHFGLQLFSLVRTGLR